jgi:hypothetical protein
MMAFQKLKHVASNKNLWLKVCAESVYAEICVVDILFRWHVIFTASVKQIIIVNINIFYVYEYFFVFTHTYNIAACNKINETK